MTSTHHTVRAERTVDVVGVGLGPFNLGLAALLDPVHDIDAMFFETEPEFAWHPGLMLPGTTLQVPFLADLVTLADPTSRYSFLNYLHERNRLYRFYFYEHFHAPRQEYDAYARWVASMLPSCRFGHQVQTVVPNTDGTWTVEVRTRNAAGEATGTDVSRQPSPGTESRGLPPTSMDMPPGEVCRYAARSVVFGVGSRPFVPDVARALLGDEIFHAADYLRLREKAVGAAAVTVVGSGQSAGEVVADLLETGLPSGQRVDWFTRSAGFLPMEYSKLGLEHFTPEYIAHFQGLPPATRDSVRAGQDLLYKGLSAHTSERIYDLLYQATIDRPDPPVTYAARCELQTIEPSPVPGRRWRLTWRHRDENRVFARDTDVVVMATGYEPAPLPIRPELVAVDEHDRPVVGPDYRLYLRDDAASGGDAGDGDDQNGACTSSLFVQNAELHTHGVGTPDLGLGAYRNSMIINAVAGREVYPVRNRTVFQCFGTPSLPPWGDRAVGSGLVTATEWSCVRSDVAAST